MLVAAMTDLARRPAPCLRPGAAWRRIIPVLLGFIAILGAASCGHPATADECRLIVDRTVELELKAMNVSDPAELARRRNTSLGSGDSGATPESRLAGCLGRHLTDRQMECVRSAKTAAEISTRCLQ
jgi:hypothetical protein